MLEQGIKAFPVIQPARATRIASLLLNRHSSREIADAIEVLVDVLDLIGGDRESEEGDAEDSFAFTTMALHMTRRVPGDITAEEDDAAYAEWHTLHASRRRSGRLDGDPIKPLLGTTHEDDEDSDPAEDDDPAEHSGDEDDTGDGEDEILSVRATQWLSDGPGCEISDPGEYDGGEHRLQCGDVRVLELNDN